MTELFTPEEKQAATRSDVTIFAESVGEEFFGERHLPTDIHRVEYVIGTERRLDAVRAYKKVDIFDLYFDKINPMGGEVLTIKNGYGSIKPKLWSSVAAGATAWTVHLGLQSYPF